MIHPQNFLLELQRRRESLKWKLGPKLSGRSYQKRRFAGSLRLRFKLKRFPFRKKDGRVFAQPTYPYDPTTVGGLITTCSVVPAKFSIHCAHLFTWQRTSPSLKKRTICSAAAIPALLFASDVWAPIFFLVTKQRAALSPKAALMASKFFGWTSATYPKSGRDSKIARRSSSCTTSGRAELIRTAFFGIFPISALLMQFF